MPKHITVTRLLIAIPMAALLFAITPPVYSATIGSFPQLYDFNMANYHTLMCIGEVSRLYVNARDIDKDDSWNDVYDPVYLKWNKLSGSAALDGFGEGLIPAGGASTATLTRWKMPTSVGINGEANSLQIEYYNHDEDPVQDKQLVCKPHPDIPGLYTWVVSHIFESPVYWTTFYNPSDVRTYDPISYEWTPADPNAVVGNTCIVPYNMELCTRKIDTIWSSGIILSEEVTVFRSYLKLQIGTIDTGTAPFQHDNDGRAFDHIAFYGDSLFDESSLVPVGTNGLTLEYKNDIFEGSAPFLVLEQHLSVDNKYIGTRFQKIYIDKDSRIGNGYANYRMDVHYSP